jgi:hypothetical protein
MSHTQYSDKPNQYNVQSENSYPPPPPPYGYGYPPMQGYVPAYPPQPVQTNGAAVAALVIGIISMIAWLLPIVGIPLSIVGIVYGTRGRRLFTNRTMATVGLVLCIIALVLAAINSLAGVMMAMH